MRGSYSASAEKHSKVLRAEWAAWISCMTEDDKPGDAKRHFSGQTSTLICHSVFVPILLLSHSLSVVLLTYTGARSKPLFHLCYDLALHNILNKESY